MTQMIMPKLPQEWEIFSIGEIAQIVYGKALRAEDRMSEGSIPVFASNGIVGKHNEALHPGPSIIIGRKGTVGAIQYILGPFWCIDTAFYLSEVSLLVDIEFLAYVLGYIDLARLSIVVGVPGINRKDIESQQIPIPPLSEQQRIVAILRQADELRRLRRKADEKLEDLVPALFVEIFGNPLGIQKEWPNFRLEDLLATDRKSITTGPFGSALKKSEYVEAGIPVWGIDNVQPNEFVEEGTYFITPSKYEDLKIYSVFKGDVLISRAGTVGRVCVAYPTPERSIISTNLVRVSLDTSRIHPEYLSTLLTYFPDSIGTLRASGDEGSYSFLNPKSLRSLQIPLPPITLQNNFFQKLTEIRKIRALQRKDLLQINTLFQTLLAQAFTGELTAKWREKQTKHTQAVEEEILESFHQFVRDYAEKHDLDLTPRPITLAQRPGTRPDLSEEQIALLYELASIQGYFTAETLKTKSALPLNTIRQGLQLFAEIGLIRVVRLPDRPMQDVVVYILSYRGLREEDQARTLDLDALLKETAS